MKFFEDNDNANIKMLDIPHRYDLSDISYVNKEIKTFNSILKNLLYNESWEEVCGKLDVNDSVKAFVEVFLLHFEMAFP